MTSRLQAEWQRLYAAAPDVDAASLLPASGRVRALVLALGQPADWSLLSRVWQGVQAELGWPAPAIAVSGAGAYQLWFSLAQAVDAAQAHVCLQALCARHLAEVHPSRLGLWPAPDASLPQGWRHAQAIPACMPDGECWSAFVAPDLAPVFADTPWLDLPPSLEGQADLLARLHSIPPEGLSSLAPELAQAPERPPRERTPVAQSPDTPAWQGSASGAGPLPYTDPRSFLLDAMNNPALDWALRIEAAKALLPR